jgi:hypothetical protein
MATFIPAGGVIISGPLQVNGAISVSGAFPAGQMLTLTNTSAAPTDADLLVIGQNAGDRGIGVRVTGDAFSRALIGTDGAYKMASGAAGADVSLQRGGANLLQCSLADLALSTAGRGLRVSEGSGGKEGAVALTAGSATVPNVNVTANSRIFLTSQADGGTPGFLRVSARTPGTNFTITSSSGTDTSTVAYEIFEPG